MSRHGMDFSFSLLSVAKSHQHLRSWSPFNTKMATTQPTKSYSSSYPSSLHLHSCEEDSAINTGRLPVTCTFLVKSNQMPARLFLSLLLASFNGRFLLLRLGATFFVYPWMIRDQDLDGQILDDEKIPHNLLE